MKCPNCGKEFDEKTGRRPKRFCTEPCKVKFWNAQKKAASKNKEPPVPQTTWTTPAGLEELEAAEPIKPKSRFQELMEQAEKELKSKK